MTESLQIFNCDQGTREWFTARMGIPTASQFSTVMAKGQGKTRRTYMLKLVGELLTGLPMENFNNAHMERGKQMEGEARDCYAVLTNTWPEPVGFLRRGRVGCSPDSLVDPNGMLEIKTKLSHLQLEVLLDGKLPSEHVAQCQGQLWIADREWLDFVSYWPNLPPLIVRVQRDEPYIEKLKTEVDAFLADMDEMVVKFEALGAKKRPPQVFDVNDEFNNVEDDK